LNIRQLHIIDMLDALGIFGNEFLPERSHLGLSEILLSKL
jgi:hypothetical protein